MGRPTDIGKVDAAHINVLSRGMKISALLMTFAARVRSRRCTRIAPSILHIRKHRWIARRGKSELSYLLRPLLHVCLPRRVHHLRYWSLRYSLRQVDPEARSKRVGAALWRRGLGGQKRSCEAAGWQQKSMPRAMQATSIARLVHRALPIAHDPPSAARSAAAKTPAGCIDEINAYGSL